MRSPLACFLILVLLMAGCASARDSRPVPDTGASRSEGLAAQSESTSRPKGQSPALKRVSLEDEQTYPRPEQTSLSPGDLFDRKILRSADLTLEVSAPAEVQRKISSIAEALGGFVVTSESRLTQLRDAKQELAVNVVVRVPAAQFGPALDQIRNAGSRVIQEKITGQDVTEEFIDLEARLKTQKALEWQFLEIMKQAHKVGDALEVQRQIAEVRTDIEKLEGRKRFLENRASLSTITVNLQSPTAIAVNTFGFGRNIREAVADSVDVASAIVLFLVRLVIVMIPISLLVILPGWLLGRYFVRRSRKLHFARGPQPATPPD